MSNSPDSPVQAYLATTKQLGFPFTYPAGYAESIDPIRRIMEEQDGGLGVWFIEAEEAVRLLQSIGKFFRLRHYFQVKRLVPFARFDNGDWVAFFDAGQPNKIFVTNLGDSPFRLHEQPEKNYQDFICDLLESFELPVPTLQQGNPQL